MLELYRYDGIIAMENKLGEIEKNIYLSYYHYF